MGWYTIKINILFVLYKKRTLFMQKHWLWSKYRILFTHTGCCNRFWQLDRSPDSLADSCKDQILLEVIDVSCFLEEKQNSFITNTYNKIYGIMWLTLLKNVLECNILMILTIHRMIHVHVYVLMQTSIIPLDYVNFLTA